MSYRDEPVTADGRPDIDGRPAWQRAQHDECNRVSTPREAQRGHPYSRDNYTPVAEAAFDPSVGLQGREYCQHCQEKHLPGKHSIPLVDDEAKAMVKKLVKFLEQTQVDPDVFDTLNMEAVQEELTQLQDEQRAALRAAQFLEAEKTIASAYGTSPAKEALEAVSAENTAKQIARERKATPVYSGCLAYFPDAIRAVARLSQIGNEQHNPGQPLHWAREKSNDHADCIVRHQLDAGTRDTDGVRHSTKVAWRALAQLQLEIEADR